MVKGPFRIRLAGEWPLLPILVVYLWFASTLWFLCDDAYITFRYAKNLARGYGVTFNPDGPPVEGYSNFSWMLYTAVLESKLLPVEWMVPATSVLLGGVLLAMVWFTCRVHLGLGRWPAAAATGALATAPAFDMWATSGLATMPFALLVFVFWERVHFASGRRAWVWMAIAGIGLATIRTEGLAWVLVIVVLGIAARWTDARRPTLRDTIRPVLVALLAIGACFLVYTSWRLAHFGAGLRAAN